MNFKLDEMYKAYGVPYATDILKQKVKGERQKVNSSVLRLDLC